MKYRNLARAGAYLIILGALTHCAPSGGSTSAAKPPAGAVTADMVSLRMGSQWKVRITDPNAGTTKEEMRTLTTVNYKGVSRNGVSNGEKVFVFNQSKNLIAILKDGKEEGVYDPDNASFSWPLWVGKT